MSKPQTEHYKQGEKARRNNVPMSANPYGHGHFHTEWKLGWETQDRVTKGLEAPHDFNAYLKENGLDAV